GMRPQLGERHPLSSELVEQGRYRLVKLVHLQQDPAIGRAHLANAGKGREWTFVDRTPGGELDDVLGADRENQLAWRAEGDDLPVIHDRNPIAQLLRFVHVVRRQQDRATFALELGDEI